MSDKAAPLLPAGRGGLHDRSLRWFVSVALRTSLVVSPRPAVLLLRRMFASGGADVARKLRAHAPAAVERLLDEPYGQSPDMVLDVFRPSTAEDALPTVVWVHGGGWIGGSKEELSIYFEIIASNGYAVVAPRYSLAPEQRYPTPARHVMQAFAHLAANAERLRLDPSRVAIAGDSAGAQIAAQVGALVTTPGYADAVGVEPTITPAQLRALVLACGPFDPSLLCKGASGPTTRRLVQAVAWAYSGHRDFLEDQRFATLSVASYVSESFPPALITVGNADPLRPHSELLVERLHAKGIEPETLFFRLGHEPRLGHEYQFDLDTEAGQLFLERMLSFLERHLRRTPRKG